MKFDIKSVQSINFVFCAFEKWWIFDWFIGNRSLNKAVFSSIWLMRIGLCNNNKKQWNKLITMQNIHRNTTIWSKCAGCVPKRQVKITFFRPQKKMNEIIICRMWNAFDRGIFICRCCFLFIIDKMKSLN